MEENEMTTHSRVPRASVFRVARPSTVDLIAVELRNAIFSGALPVGAPIVEIEIASQLGVSRSPLREATQRLVQEGLLTPQPGRGLHVTRIDPAHVGDLYRARIAVEGEAIRVIAADPHPAVIAALETMLKDLEEASRGEDARAIGNADLAFHQTLVDEAGSLRLSGYMATLVIETRIATFSHPSGYTVRRSVSPTYRELLSALAAGDADAAVSALREQFGEAVERLTGTARGIDTVEASPDDAPPPVEPIGRLQ